MITASIEFFHKNGVWQHPLLYGSVLTSVEINFVSIEAVNPILKTLKFLLVREVLSCLINAHLTDCKRTVVNVPSFYVYRTPDTQTPTSRCVLIRFESTQCCTLFIPLTPSVVIDLHVAKKNLHCCKLLTMWGCIYTCSVFNIYLSCVWPNLPVS